jgi:hypothetical protein
VVSAGALTSLDDGELYAGLDHERGHIDRRHRWVLVAAAVLRGLARPLPGTRAAAEELAFHLERDADRFALRRDNEPLDLATAICKAAGGANLGVTAMALNGGGAARRVRQLLESSDATSRPMPRCRDDRRSDRVHGGTAPGDRCGRSGNRFAPRGAPLRRLTFRPASSLVLAGRV